LSSIFSSPGKFYIVEPYQAAEKRAEATSEARWDVCSTMSFPKGLRAKSIAKLFFSSLLHVPVCGTAGIDLRAGLFPMDHLMGRFTCRKNEIDLTPMTRASGNASPIDSARHT
jgi:hypothetical protein